MRPTLRRATRAVGLHVARHAQSYALWAVSRTWVVYWLLHAPENNASGDPGYYKYSLDGLSAVGVHGTLQEYPVPALIALALPYFLLKLLHLLTLDHYEAAICVLAALIDLAFYVQLHRSPARPAWLGRLMWLMAVPALGATAYARFDLIPGILVALALFYAVRRPGLAAVFGVLAGGVKYWPVIVLPALGAPRLTRRRTVLAAVASGAVVGLVSLALGGWHRIWSPLSYQKVRGLQIESVWATPAMLHWARNPQGSDSVYYSMDSHSYQIYAPPRTDALLHAATIATIVVGVVLVALWVVAWIRLRDPASSISAIAWLVLASVSGFMVTSKVLSPQYLLWLLPVAAAALVVVPRPWSLTLWSGLLIVAACLTHVIYPRDYVALLAHTDQTMQIAYVLFARNVLLVGLFCFATVEAAFALAERRPAVVDEGPGDPSQPAQTVGAAG